MGAIYDFEEEKLIVGLIYSDKELLSRAICALTERFGEIEDETEEFSFSREFSNYYDGELGGEGLRRIYSFKKTVNPSLQAEIKEFTNNIEASLSVDGCRRVNIDPGFISHGRLMLATTKKAGFRIPLARGIYTEMTLFYAKGRWHKLPWTYRDYQDSRVQEFLTRARKSYLNQRKELAESTKEINNGDV